MSLQNQVQLITYVDRLTGKGLTTLESVLENELKGLFGGVHLLPFYFPIDGQDAGFDPIDHTAVDTRLGNWADVKAIGEHYDVMADMIVNHVSAQSEAFQDVLTKGESSCYRDLFLTKETVFDDSPSEQDLAKIYRPRPTSCFSEFELGSGQAVSFWTTFTSNQIDININSNAGKAYLDSILEKFAANNIRLIRLDAAGYAVKKAGTSCFMLPETFEFIGQLSEQAKAMKMTTLVEIHSYYQTQCEIAKRVDLVYDFALPPLILHTLFAKDAEPLSNWLAISPRNCVTVLDTHDGIGIVDVGKEGDRPGLLSDAQIDALVDQIHLNSQGQSQQATGAAANNVDLYQVNCTYYDALGADDEAYLLARAIQFFCPGTPQVYYTGLLAVQNDMELLAKTQVGRDINRAYLSREQIQQQLQLPVVKALCQLIEWRNRVSAFNGEFSQSLQNGELHLEWKQDESVARLIVNTELGRGELYFKEAGEITLTNTQAILEKAQS